MISGQKREIIFKKYLPGSNWNTDVDTCSLPKKEKAQCVIAGSTHGVSRTSPKATSKICRRMRQVTADKNCSPLEWFVKQSSAFVIRDSRCAGLTCKCSWSRAGKWLAIGTDCRATGCWELPFPTIRPLCCCWLRRDTWPALCLLAPTHFFLHQVSPWCS